MVISSLLLVFFLLNEVRFNVVENTLNNFISEKKVYLRLSFLFFWTSVYNWHVFYYMKMSYYMYMYIEHPPPPPRSVRIIIIWKCYKQVTDLFTSGCFENTSIVITLYRYFIDFNVGNWRLSQINFWRREKRERMNKWMNDLYVYRKCNY